MWKWNALSDVGQLSIIVLLRVIMTYMYVLNYFINVNSDLQIFLKIKKSCCINIVVNYNIVILH